jgi:hypothetical protein
MSVSMLQMVESNPWWKQRSADITTMSNAEKTVHAQECALHQSRIDTSGIDRYYVTFPGAGFWATNLQYYIASNRPKTAPMPVVAPLARTSPKKDHRPAKSSPFAAAPTAEERPVSILSATPTPAAVSIFHRTPLHIRADRMSGKVAANSASDQGGAPLAPTETENQADTSPEELQISTGVAPPGDLGGGASDPGPAPGGGSEKEPSVNIQVSSAEDLKSRLEYYTRILGDMIDIQEGIELIMPGDAGCSVLRLVDELLGGMLVKIQGQVLESMMTPDPHTPADDIASTQIPIVPAPAPRADSPLASGLSTVSPPKSTNV